MKTALVVGAGPAGLMAADVLSAAGVRVTVADHMPSVGRKFLMAGKSGLNLTKITENFQSAYHPKPKALMDALDAFGPREVITWVEGLGQEVFTGSTGRVFPKTMKASPLLRAWLARLNSHGVAIRTRWRWQGRDGRTSQFLTPDGEVDFPSDAIVLAMGGASWRRLGSDGDWSDKFTQITPFLPANVGLTVEWSHYMAPHLGRPVKGVKLSCGDLTSRGEFVLSTKGIEGGGVYEISRSAREGSPVLLDLLPDQPIEKISETLSRRPAKVSLSNFLRKSFRLDPQRLALLNEWGRPFPKDLAPLLKALPVRHDGPRPIDEAISTAGGLRFDALSDDLMFNSAAGLFACGEMLDWEAPTGGYLLTGCLATGAHAAKGALKYLGIPPSVDAT